MPKGKSRQQKPKYTGPEPRKGFETRERKFALIDRIKSLRRAKLGFEAIGDRFSRWPRAFSTKKKIEGKNAPQLIGLIKVGDKTTYYYVDRRIKKGTVSTRKKK